MIRAISIAVIGIALAVPAWAQPAPPPAPAPTGTNLTLTAHVEKMLPRDQLHAELRAEAVGADAAHVQTEVNNRMASALTRAKAATGIDVETRGYVVYQERDAKGNPTDWHGSQTVRLTSADFPALLNLVGALQGDGLVMSDLAAELSPAAAKTAQDDLTDAALKEIRARAERIAATLGTHVERYAELHVGSVSMPPVAIRAMAAVASSSMPPPVAAAGDATVSVNVNATVILAPVR